MSRKSPSQSQRNARSILLRDYMQQVAPIDRLSQDDLRPVLMGLFGEVGSMIGTAEKLHREKRHMPDISMRSKRSSEMPCGT